MMACRPNANQSQHWPVSEPTVALCWFTDKMTATWRSNPTGVPTAGRRRVADSLPTECRSKPALTWQQADWHSDSGSMSGCQFTADQMSIKIGIAPQRPDSGPTACRHRTEVKMSGSHQNRTSARQRGNNTYPSGHWTDVVVPTSGRRCGNMGLLHLCWHPADVVLVSIQCRFNVLQIKSSLSNDGSRQLWLWNMAHTQTKRTKNMKSKCSNYAYLLYNRTTLHISSLHIQPLHKFGHLCATFQSNDMDDF